MVFFRFTATYVTLKKQWVKKLENRIGYHKHSKHFLPIEYTKIPRRPNLEKKAAVPSLSHLLTSRKEEQALQEKN